MLFYDLSPVCIPCDTQLRSPARSNPAPPSRLTSWILLETKPTTQNQPYVISSVLGRVAYRVYEDRFIYGDNAEKLHICYNLRWTCMH